MFPYFAWKMMFVYPCNPLVSQGWGPVPLLPLPKDFLNKRPLAAVSSCLYPVTSTSCLLSWALCHYWSLITKSLGLNFILLFPLCSRWHTLLIIPSQSFLLPWLLAWLWTTDSPYSTIFVSHLFPYPVLSGCLLCGSQHSFPHSDAWGATGV